MCTSAQTQLSKALEVPPAQMLSSSKIALIGAGRLGESLLTGLLESGRVVRENVVATAVHQDRISSVAERFQVRTTLDNPNAVKGADVILLSVKPQSIKKVLAEIRDGLSEDQLIISTAPSFSTAQIECLLGKRIPVVRAMPNTPSVLRLGMTGLCAGRHARSGHLELAQQVFDCVGRTVLLDEKHMDAVTGLSASGPAYVFIIIESLAEGGVKMGLPRDIATLLAAQTVFGAARMVLETGEHPARLKDMVTTPEGCAIDGILELEEGGLRVTLIKTVVHATQSAKELVQA
jgi:pyrroline-5-carboxylate reductase